MPPHIRLRPFLRRRGSGHKLFSPFSPLLLQSQTVGQIPRAHAVHQVQNQPAHQHNKHRGGASATRSIDVVSVAALLSAHVLDNHGIGLAIAEWNVADISYSVKRALKFRAKTASTLGSTMGSFTLRKVNTPLAQGCVRHPPAPRRWHRTPLNHAQGEWQFDHRIGHDDEETHVLAHVQVGVEDIPHILGVEERAVGNIRMVGKSQWTAGCIPARWTAFCRVFEDVVDPPPPRITQASAAARPKARSSADTAYRVRIGEQTGDGVGPRLELPRWS